MRFGNLCVAFLFLAPGLGRAQPPNDRERAPVSLPQMYEDIEIFRRILNQALRDRWASLYTDQALTYAEFAFWTGTFQNAGGSPPMYGVPTYTNPQGAHTGGIYGTGTSRRADAFVPADGVYLKGYGVVYSLALPLPSRSPKPSETKPAPKTASEWDRVRKQLRGEKVAKASAADAGHNPTLADIILKVLADNGHHFAQLKVGENLTIVVTLRGSPQATSGRTAGTVWKAKSNVVGAARPDTVIGVVVPTEVNDLTLFGDLHLKQGRPKEAIDAYLKVAKKHPRSVSAELMRKLSQAYLAANDLDNAKKWLDKALDRQSKPGAVKEPPAAQAPSRLILTASKHLLDQVADGRMNLADFRRAVTVEEVPQPAEAKK